MADLIDTIQAEGTLTTFTRALKTSELIIPMREPGAYTVFAPLESIKVNGATIVRANMRADNGIVHVIDKVLIPAFTEL